LDKNRADIMIVDGLSRFYDNKLYGSEWPLFTQRNHTYMLINDKAVILT